MAALISCMSMHNLQLAIWYIKTLFYVQLCQKMVLILAVCAVGCAIQLIRKRASRISKDDCAICTTCPYCKSHRSSRRVRRDRSRVCRHLVHHCSRSSSAKRLEGFRASYMYHIKPTRRSRECQPDASLTVYDTDAVLDHREFSPPLEYEADAKL